MAKRNTVKLKTSFASGKSCVSAQMVIQTREKYHCDRLWQIKVRQILLEANLGSCCFRLGRRAATLAGLGLETHDIQHPRGLGGRIVDANRKSEKMLQSRREEKEELEKPLTKFSEPESYKSCAKQNPKYRTSNHEYGQQMPNTFELQKKRHYVSKAFSEKCAQAGPYRNYGLNAGKLKRFDL